MRRRLAIVILFLGLMGIWASYTSCGQASFTKVQGSSTVVGNPFTASDLVVQAVCSTLTRCYSQLTTSNCTARVSSESGAASSLGLPASFDSQTLGALSQAEQGGTLTENNLNVKQCATAIGALSCTSTAVQGAYDPAALDSLAGAVNLVTTSTASCMGSLAVSSPAPAPSPVPIYGVAIAGDQIGNFQVGGPDCGCSGQSKVSYRFRAQGSVLQSVRFYLNDGSGDAGGNGGSYEVSLQADDGSQNHLPSGVKLATASLGSPSSPIGNPLAGTAAHFPLVSFGGVSLTAGQLYHVVIVNTDSNPSVNYMSVENLYQQSVVSPRQPLYNDIDFAQLASNGGGWSVQANYTPILQLTYGGGTLGGMGYIDAWASTGKTISGASRVREVFAATKSVGPFTKAYVRVSRQSGTSALTALWEDAAGNAIAQCLVPAAAFGSAVAWGTCSFSGGFSLSAGQSYHLVLSAPADTVYTAVALRKGSAFGFAAPAIFGDGHGEFDAGSGWLGFSASGGAPTAEGDLQFYLAQ